MLNGRYANAAAKITDGKRLATLICFSLIKLSPTQAMSIEPTSEILQSEVSERKEPAK